MAPSQLDIGAARQRFYDQGVSVVDWAREHGFDVHLVYGVLSGRSRASRGESHRIAIALGLKAVPLAAPLMRGQTASSAGQLPEEVAMQR
ncbi:MAG: DNA-binding protein [Pseudorhodoferax sp.]